VSAWWLMQKVVPAKNPPTTNRPALSARPASRPTVNSIYPAGSSGTMSGRTQVGNMEPS
jgi:hypothetical protein